MQKVAFSAARRSQPDVAKIVDWFSEFKGDKVLQRYINYVLTRKGIYEKTVLAYLIVSVSILFC
jgi:hypothetical protein